MNFLKLKKKLAFLLIIGISGGTLFINRGEGYEVIYTTADLSGHTLSAECNPGGGTSCSCSDADVDLLTFGTYGQVISNVNATNTWANGIAGKKWWETFPNGDSIFLGTYKYSGEFRIPVVPAANVAQMENGQAVEMSIQFWDGRNALFESNKTQVEATVYWMLNAWDSNYGAIQVYNKNLSLVDTGITIPPDTQWHSFEFEADVLNQKWVSITIDGQTKDISSIDLANVAHSDWDDSVALAITQESMATWPGASCGTIFTLTTEFRNLVFSIGANPLVVPTASQWGYISLTLLLLGSGLFAKSWKKSLSKIERIFSRSSQIKKHTV